jgi:hypothetical protein
MENICEHAQSTFKRNSCCFVAMGFGKPLKFTGIEAGFCPSIPRVKERILEYFGKCTGDWYLKRCADQFTFTIVYHAQSSL